MRTSGNTGLRPNETRAILYAQFLGSQAQIIDRLLALSVPGKLVDAHVVLAANDEQRFAAGEEIIQWLQDEYKLTPEAADRLANGRSTLQDELEAVTTS